MNSRDNFFFFLKVNFRISNKLKAMSQVNFSIMSIVPILITRTSFEMHRLYLFGINSINTLIGSTILTQTFYILSHILGGRETRFHFNIGYITLP